MPEAIKVLLADGSSVMRHLTSHVLENAPLIGEVQQARDGTEAVRAFSEFKPDVVILEVEMPTMDGFQAAAAIWTVDSTVPIILFSSPTAKCGTATPDERSIAASDFVAKPASTDVSEAIEHIKKQLVPKIHLWGKKRLSGDTSLPGSNDQSTMIIV